MAFKFSKVFRKLKLGTESIFQVKLSYVENKELFCEYGLKTPVFKHLVQGKLSPLKETTTEHILTRGKPSVVSWLGIAST